MTDSYTDYETGVRALLARLGRDHPRTAEAQVYQQRLHENLAATRRYGDTESRRAERAEIVDRLNALAQAALGVRFNALCGEGEAPGEAPPVTPITYVHTGGGAYVGGNVTVEGGDFVGRDKDTRDTLPEPPDKPLVYAPLLIWADLPQPLPSHAPRPRVRAIQQLQKACADLPPLPFDVTALPPVCLLSLDPSDRVEQAWTDAERAFAVILSRQNVPPRAGTSLLKLAGDLDSAASLWLGWDEVQNARNDPDKTHLLAEARRHARDNTVVVLAQRPDDAFTHLWPLLRPLIAAAEHAHVVGPTGYDWPAPLEHAGTDPARVLDLLPTIEALAPIIAVPRGTDREIIERLNRILQNQEGLRRGQVTIYRRLSDAEKQQVAELQKTAIALQHSNAAALGDLQRAVDSLRRALIDIRNRQLASMDEDVREILHEVTEVLGADVGIGTELQLLIPFLPFLVKVDLGGSVDVRQLVENLIARIRRHSET
jgi:hypothetical protein